jgi:hypothetical protein
MSHEWVLTVGAGISDPTGLFEEQMKAGQHATAELGYHFNPSWLLGLRGAYFPFDAEPAWQAASGLDRIRFWNLDLESRLMLYPESWFTPYILLGAGADLETQYYSDAGGERSVDVVRPVATGGVGLSLHRQSKFFSFYTELIYHHMPSDNGSRQFLRWTSGLRFSVGGRPF